METTPPAQVAVAGAASPRVTFLPVSWAVVLAAMATTAAAVAAAADQYNLISLNPSGGDGGFGGGSGAGHDVGQAGFAGGGASHTAGGGGGALGGAIFNDGGTLTVLNCTFTANFVDRGVAGGPPPADNGGDAGGAIFSLNGSLNVFNSTICSNQATGFGGGVVVLQFGFPVPSTSFTLYNTIIANNGSNECAVAGFTVTTAGSSNIIMLNLSCPGVVSTADPLVGPLQFNAPGSTPTMAIGTQSPAFDAGDGSWCQAFDQRGVIRPQGVRCDIGAFEVISNSPPVALCASVTVSADANCMASASIDNGSFDPDPGDSVSLSQSPAGPYPRGTNVVTLTVTDNHGATSSCTALVIVKDTTPPSVSCPPNQVVNATMPSGAVVNYPNAVASDNCGIHSLTYSKNAGTVFPIGTTTVTTRATDVAGNTTTCTFTVTVLSAAQQAANLITLVNSLPNVDSGIQNALAVKVDAALNVIGQANSAARSSILNDFLNDVSAQAGKHLTVPQANLLTAEATRIRVVLGYP
jgi:hypothetical protein